MGDKRHLFLYDIDRWGKISKEGLPIPVRCPHCNSRKTVIVTYGNLRIPTVECEGCYTVILEYPRNNKHLRRIY